MDRRDEPAIYGYSRFVQKFLKAELLLQVFGLKPCTLGDPGEHARADLFIVVEGKDEVRPSGAREDAM